MPRRIVTLFIAATLVMLAACKSDEQRAEELYQEGISALAKGDEETALTDFREAIKRNDLHRPARLAIINVLTAEGQTDAARVQLNVLLERFPDDLDAHIALAELALASENQEAAQKQTDILIGLAPTDPRVVATVSALDYNTAVQANNLPQIIAAAQRAEAALKAAPDATAARRAVIWSYLHGDDPRAALPFIEAYLEKNPGSLEFNMMKLNAFSRAKDSVGGGAQLKVMYQLFPDNTDVRTWLYEWYVAQGNNDETLAFLRDLANRAPQDPALKSQVVEFLLKTQGSKAAEAELLEQAKASKDVAEAEALRIQAAKLAASDGRQSAATEALTEIITKSQSANSRNDARVLLAGILHDKGEGTKALALADEALAEDPSRADVMKLKAQWLLDANKPHEAAELLLAAIGYSAKDPSLRVMLARAYDADGSADLAGRTYGLALELSDNGAAEAMQYYAFLVRNGRLEAGEAVLNAALQSHPDAVEILAVLIDRVTAQLNWSRARSLLEQLQAIDSDGGRAAAKAAAQQISDRQAGSKKILGLLQDLADQRKPNISDRAAAVKALIEKADTDGASKSLSDLANAAPSDAALQELVKMAATFLDGLKPAP